MVWRRSTRVEAVLHPEIRPSPHDIAADRSWTPGAYAVARDADLLVAESTFLDTDRELALRYRHLTALPAGRLAAESGARELVLTHFSQRYPHDEAERFRAEAATVFTGEIHLAADLDVIPFPSRR